MSRTVKLVLAYDGGGFHGWQAQPGLRTVQDELEQVLRRVCGHPLRVHGASRTDAGVHAAGQVVSFIDHSRIPIGNLCRAVGHRLPQDMVLLHVSEPPQGFHASRCALGKLYRYRVFNTDRRPASELVQRYVYHLWLRLDLDRTRAAASRLVGTHDFAGFASSGSPRPNTVRTVRRVEVRRVFDEVLIDVEGDGFLYNQVRNMVGTLIEVGRGHWPVERIDGILAGRDRTLAGPTAPAHGLCLRWVRY